MHITVTSTALNCAKYAERCVESVIRQTFTCEDVTHHYFDAGSDDDTVLEASKFDWFHTGQVVVHEAIADRPEALEQLVPFWRSLPEDEVVVWLDGDDWLAHDHALEIVVYAHKNGALATYGQFVTTRGEVGFARERLYSRVQVPGSLLVRRVPEDVRTGPWFATHLKTFRAGFARLIRDEDLHWPGDEWLHYAIDQAIMIPILEMAPELTQFIPNILYVYNTDHGFLKEASPLELATDQAAVRWIRSRPPHERLDADTLTRLRGET